MLPRLLVQSLPSLWSGADDDSVAFLSSFVTTAFPCQSLKPLPATSVLERAKGGVWRLQRDLCSGARWAGRASLFLLVSGCGQTPGLVPRVLSHLRWDPGSPQPPGCWRHLQPGVSYWHQGVKYLIKSGWFLQIGQRGRLWREPHWRSGGNNETHTKNKRAKKKEMSQHKMIKPKLTSAGQSVTTQLKHVELF